MQKVAERSRVQGWASLRLLENFLCQPSSKWVTFLNQGKNKAAKGAGLAPPFFGCALDTVGL